MQVNLLYIRKTICVQLAFMKVGTVWVPLGNTTKSSQIKLWKLTHLLCHCYRAVKVSGWDSSVSDSLVVAMGKQSSPPRAASWRALLYVLLLGWVAGTMKCSPWRRGLVHWAKMGVSFWSVLEWLKGTSLLSLLQKNDFGVSGRKQGALLKWCGNQSPSILRLDAEGQTHVEELEEPSLLTQFHFADENLLTAVTSRSWKCDIFGFFVEM